MEEKLWIGIFVPWSDPPCHQIDCFFTTLFEQTFKEQTYKERELKTTVKISRFPFKVLSFWRGFR